MLIAEFLDLGFADACALSEQALERLRPGAEGRGLLHQRAVTVESLTECRGQRHRFALGARARA